ncbi:MAG: hypothetical protein WC700_17550 [Gemmatimonadaceae bacterium]|jgi:hypothetical protein
MAKKKSQRQRICTTVCRDKNGRFQPAAKCRAGWVARHKKKR